MATQDFIESVDTFNVNFGGPSHSIDAELFTNTINNTIELVKASAKAIDPNCFLRLEIKANQQGSFKTVIDAVAKHAIDLFNKGKKDLASEVILGFFGFLEIKFHLDGKKAKQINKEQENTKIINQNNTSITINNHIANAFFETPHIDNNISEIFSDLSKFNKENFLIEHPQKKVFFGREHYETMSQQIVDDPSITRRTEKQKPVEVNLLLKKPDLLGDSAWQFVYNKNIYAKIEDTVFLQHVRQGKIKLYSGIKIPCLLEIEYELDEQFNPIPNSDRYTIKKVIGDLIEPPTQSDIFEKIS